MSCSNKNEPTPKNVPAKTEAQAEATDASNGTTGGWQAIDESTLDSSWRSLVESCLAKKREDGQNIDDYELVQTKSVDGTRFLYFTPKPSPDGMQSSEHFGCRFDEDGTIRVLYEG